MSFKVGDKVRYLGDYYSTVTVGVVTKVLPPNILWPYVVDFENLEDSPCDEVELELVE